MWFFTTPNNKILASVLTEKYSLSISFMVSAPEKFALPKWLLVNALNYLLL